MYVCYWTLLWTLMWQAIQECTSLPMNTSLSAKWHVRHNHCSLGTYSRQHTCVPCSRCEEESFELYPCSPRRDTVCQACQETVEQPSADFLIKCQSPSQSTYSRPPSSSTVAPVEPLALPSNNYLPLTADESSAFTDGDKTSDIQNARHLALFQGFVFLTVVSVVIGATCKSRICVHEFHLVAKQDDLNLPKNNDEPA